MATTVARLEAVLSAQTRDYDRAMDRSEKRTTKMGKAAGVAGLAIAAGLGVLAKRGFDEFNSQQAATAATESVLKSMGKTAGVTAKDVAGLADSISKKSGIDDEAIQSGENLLLTFRNIKNQVGENNDIFNQATTIMADFSVRFGKDIPSSAILVGKALNDPIKGLTALSRVGVQFTEDQKKMIKEMVASGNTLGAQKIIMAELTAETKGAAEAQGNTLAGSLAKAKNAFDDVAATLVVMVLPAFTKLIEKITVAVTWLDKNKTAAKVLVTALGGLAVALMAARAAQILLNLAVLANPYVAAAALLVAYGVVLYKFESLTTKAKVAVVALTTTFSPLGAVILVVRGHMDKVMTVLEAFKNRGGEMLQPVIAAFRTLAKVIASIVNAIRWLINHIPDIPSPPKVPSWLDPRNIGDAKDPSMKVPAGSSPGLMGASPVMQPFATLGAMYGLRVTSGLRPGAITANGTLSDHAVGKALDMADGPASMAGFFKTLIGNPRVKQAFYDPLGSIFGGALSGYREGGHDDHVHVATYDKGGWLKPGLTLAYNGTGAPERVGGGAITINLNGPVYGSKQHMVEMIQNAAQEFKRRNGRSAF